LNNKLKIAIVSSLVLTTSVMSAAPALAANYDNSGNKIGFFERIGLMLGFKKVLSPEKQAQRIEEMKQRHEAKLNTRLDALVGAGTISEAQKNELKTKIDAIQQAKLSSAGKTKEEKKQAFKQARTDLKAWAEANGIDLGQIMPKRAQGNKHGMMQNQ